MSVGQRIVAGTAATLSWQAVDQDGEPSDPGTTTVEVTRSDGSSVIAAGTAATAVGALRTIAIDPQDVDELTAVWTGTTAVETTFIAVVGGVYFTSAELRDEQPSVVSTVEYPLARVLKMRQVIEVVFEQSTGVYFVPRFQQIAPSNGFCRQRGVREVRWVRLTNGTFVTTNLDSYVERTAGGVIVLSTAVDLVGLVAGFARTPEDIWRVAMLAVRHLLTSNSLNMDYRVMAVSNPDGSMSQYATPGLSLWVTGIPEVDEALKRYRPLANPKSISTAPGMFR